MAKEHMHMVSPGRLASPLRPSTCPGMLTAAHVPVHHLYLLRACTTNVEGMRNSMQYGWYQTSINQQFVSCDTRCPKTLAAVAHDCATAVYLFPAGLQCWRQVNSCLPRDLGMQLLCGAALIGEGVRFRSEAVALEVDLKERLSQLDLDLPPSATRHRQQWGLHALPPRCTCTHFSMS